MGLWLQWYRVVQQLRQACSRKRTFCWLVVSLAMFSLPHDDLGVSGLVRAGRLASASYRGFLRLFHSTSVNLTRLTQLWTKLVLRLFQPVTVDGIRPLVAADGVKAPKEGLKMPGVKSLHQESGNNSKPEFIMGHSLQALALLVRAGASRTLAVPLIARIHEGVKFSNRDRRTLPQKLGELVAECITPVFPTSIVLVADAYYACAPLIFSLLQAGHHLISRVRSTAVAYTPIESKSGVRGRPRKYGDKVQLQSLFREKRSQFRAVRVNLYGEENAIVHYLSIELLWKPLKRLARFVLVEMEGRGKVILLSTDMTLSAQDIIESYGRRFQIEVTFRGMIHSIKAFCYRFWMKGMKSIRRGGGTQHLHRAGRDYCASVGRKLAAYHLWIQLALIAQGLLQHLAVNCGASVWAAFTDFMRTIRKDVAPSEQVVASALREQLPKFSMIARGDGSLRKFLDDLRADAARVRHRAFASG